MHGYRRASFRRARLVAIVCALLLVTADCGDDAVSPGDGKIEATLTIDPDTVSPGGTFKLNLLISPPVSTRIERVELALSGIYTERDSLPTGPEGPLWYLGDLVVPREPVEGSVFFQVFVWAGAHYDSTSRVELVVRDDGPPTATLVFDGDQGRVEANDTVEIQYAGVDDGGVASLTLSVSGAVEAALVRNLTRPEAEVGGPFSLVIPDAVGLGDSVNVRLVVTDLFGKADTAAGMLRVSDLTAPDLQAALVSPQRTYGGGSVLLIGDTVQVDVAATDTRGLTWLGYRVPALGVADSVPASGRTMQRALTFAIEAAGGDTVSRLILFARDSASNVGADSVTVRLVGGVERPLDTVMGSYQGLLFPDDQILDAKRNRALVVGNQVILAVDLTTMEVTDTLRPPGGSFTIDIVRGGDTAVVSIAGSRSLGIIDLTATPLRLDTLPLVASGFPDRRAFTVRRVVPNRLFVTLGRLDGQPDTALYEIDLTTGTQTLRGDLDHLGELSRSGDGTYLLFQGQQHRVYRATADSFVTLPFGPLQSRAVVDSTGTRVIIQRRLYDGLLQPIRDLLPSGSAVTSYALTPDGSTAFFTEYLRFTVIPVQTGTGLAGTRMYVPAFDARALLALPDERVLLSVGGWLMVLTP